MIHTEVSLENILLSCT